MKIAIQKIFSEVSKTYELVNHVLTFGLDVVWRKKAAREAAQVGGTFWLDVCSGTGEMAQNLSSLASRKVKVVAVDFSPIMLTRLREKPQNQKISLALAEANCLPFANETFNLVTISFATRNINISREDLITHFKEFYRVLKPGGRFVNLETSQPRQKIIRRIFHLYVRLVVFPIGYLFSGSKAAYKYLSSTICRFYQPEELSQFLYEAGFHSVSFEPLFFGVSAIHTAFK